MATAFLLLNVVIGTEEMVMRKLESIQEIKEARMVYGVYDLIVRIETEDIEGLKNLVSWRIRRLDNVRSTMTMIVV